MESRHLLRVSEGALMRRWDSTPAMFFLYIEMRSETILTIDGRKSRMNWGILKRRGSPLFLSV
ncbi:hypothetical protein BMD20_18740 [Burkholderia multivorans]|nr:hypothetical protein BMD20_18740 [Burkholderia multivorans]KHS13502.1 hypothetical protein BMD22_21515 [Burkholderia multivorans]KVP19871.1 hypothetical protein WJ86_24865 [Burkholderia multivorans]PRD71933.1 hypothetical protein C6P75_22995 [Burkholderia multivorans]